jgi:hypothetical protein
VVPERHSDAELLIAVASRDLEAMRELYDRHAAWLSSGWPGDAATAR